VTNKNKKSPAVGWTKAAGRHEFLIVARFLNHAEHDGADKGEGEICGGDA
jgi:hypothetical protein